MMENSIYRSLLCVLPLLCGLTFGSVDFCLHDLFNDAMNKNFMHFSKENSEWEFAVIDGFKSLHCCSYGYRSIEWFKDGKPYPWSTDVSTLIISPEYGNQTIYSQVVSEVDSGGYWCIVRNDTHSLRHDVYLKVSDQSELDGPPKPTYRPKNVTVDLGQDARFYCEAFIGNITLHGLKSNISWWKSDSNTSIFSSAKIRQEVKTRDENQILGSYLFITDVEMDDFGKYVCRIRSGLDDQFIDMNVFLNKEDKTGHISISKNGFNSTVLIALLLILSGALSAVSLMLFRSQFRLFYHRFIHKNGKRRTKEHDILFVCHMDDKDLTVNKISNTLQNNYNYTCQVHEVTCLKSNLREIKEKSVSCKRLIIVLSNALLDNEWSCGKLTSILRNFINVHPRIIIILLKTLPVNEEEEDVSALRGLLQLVYCVEYRESKAHRFWDLLTLGLPGSNSSSEIKENVELV